LRAAELLEASGAAGGIGTGAGIPFAGVELAKVSSEDNLELSDADFSVVIKRMSKKDSTTKLKVLNC